jgi:hypothetical protein
MIRRTVVAASSGLLLVLFASSAAAVDRKACIVAADDGQKLRDEGKLSAARDKFIACAEKGCPAAVSKQCAVWVEEVDHEMPTLSFRAKDEGGKEILDVQVVLDDKPIAESIATKAMTLDPGTHKIRFVRKDGKSIEDTFLLRPGEKDRIVELAFQAPKIDKPLAVETPAVAPGGGFRFPWPAWVGLGLTVVGGVGTAAFAASAASDESDLRKTCAPSCPSDQRSGIETKLVLANVSLGVGIAGLGLTVVSLILANVGHKETPPKTSGFFFGPTAGGAAAGFQGAF